MAGTAEKERVKTSLSEVRTLILGAQILLGFQYRAAFEPRYPSLPLAAQYLQVAALVLLIASTACLIAPTSYHRMVAGGQATAGMERYTNRMALVALVPFALALGANFGVALAPEIGLTLACALGGAVALVAAMFWFAPALARRDGGGPKEDEMVSTKERITELLTEARIILPGVQALLGFQFASYLTQACEKLPPAAQAVNTGSLLLLVLAMILLMTPAPYHRLAERGEDTEHFERVAEKLVLAALPPLALGIAGDVYVVVQIVLGPVAGIMVALACAAGMVALWFGVPLAARRGRQEC